MIIAFGNPVYDFIQTPISSTHQRVLSGCSTNACLALAKMGHATALVGRVGPDYATQFLSETHHYGITPFVQPCEQTGGFQLIYSTWADRTLDILGVAEPIEQIPEACADAEAIIIGPILQETPASLIAQIRAVSRAPLILDPQGLLRRINGQGRIEHYCPANFAQIAALCDVVKANEQETQVITGIDPRVDGREALRRLKSLGCKIAIVTLAEAGSLIDDGKHHYNIPVYPAKVCDTTGAGDTYMAGFLHRFLQEPEDMQAAGCFGASTASIWIEHTGPDAPVTLQEVERRVNHIRAYTEVL